MARWKVQAELGRIYSIHDGENYLCYYRSEFKAEFIAEYLNIHKVNSDCISVNSMKEILKRAEAYYKKAQRKPNHPHNPELAAKAALKDTCQKVQKKSKHNMVFKVFFRQINQAVYTIHGSEVGGNQERAIAAALKLWKAENGPALLSVNVEADGLAKNAYDTN